MKLADLLDFPMEYAGAAHKCIVSDFFNNMDEGISETSIN